MTLVLYSATIGEVPPDNSKVHYRSGNWWYSQAYGPDNPAKSQPWRSDCSALVTMVTKAPSALKRLQGFRNVSGPCVPRSSAQSDNAELAMSPAQGFFKGIWDVDHLCKLHTEFKSAHWPKTPKPNLQTTMSSYHVEF